jgi:hypothetical protein
MDLQHQCLPAVGETVDQSDPPQRTAAVQAPGDESATGGIELFQPARLRQDCMAEMRCEVKVRILDQHRVSQAEGDRNESPPERRELVKSVGEVPAQILQGERDAGARPEQPQGDTLHWLFGQLHMEEDPVQTAEPS